MTPGAGRAVVVIPAYEPAAALVDLVEAIAGAEARSIVVVDDGSSAAAAPIFERIARIPRVVLLAHAVNLGKGQALKTAFNHVLLHAGGDIAGVVTADADGQHLAADVLRVAARLESSPGSLVLGSRSFEGRVPLRNRAGNVITRGVFRLIVGRRLVDTQTGLRGIPRAFLGELLTLEAGRYEFELEMLVRATERRIPIEQIAITTVYGGDTRSHFNPLRDSLRIYFVFVRFAGLSLVTAAIDYSTFAVVYAGAGNILLATVAARALAGVFNFAANRTVVFRSRGSIGREAAKYAALVVALMSVSYGLVTTLVIVLGFGVYVSKLLAEGALFAASFALQDLVVFAGSRRGDAPARDATDWDAYYRRPALLAPLTRRFTERIVVREVSRALGADEPGHIVELGGGNSGFLAAFRARFPDARLTAIDSNLLGLQLLEARLGGGAVAAIAGNVLAPVADSLAADVVYSVGLVEHFDSAGTARAVRAHFDHTRPGGIVLITFPTPTWLYRLVRRAAERAGLWAFPDERPLAVEEVSSAARSHGDVLRLFVNWRSVLTQAVIVVRKR
jgi:glycosyltransferase involved in cell wall biosynthesis/SAM-dependent methyltransferase